MLKSRVTLRLSVQEAEYLMGALDIWIEGYTDTVDDDDMDVGSLSSLMDDMDIGLKIRDRLFRRLT